MSAPDTPPRLTVTFLGTATVLLRYRDLTVLTDPNFLHRGQRAYLGYGLSSPRLTEPALSVEELPTLDGIVLSHLHGDHFDRVARRGLAKDVPIVTTTHAAPRLRRRGFANATGIGTWQSTSLRRGDTEALITALPARHAGEFLQRLLPPVMGSLLELRHGGDVEARLYISGDTILFDGLSAIPRRFPDIDAGIVHLGGTTLPGGFVVTLDAAGGADLMELLGPVPVVPVHYDDYSVFKSPLSHFRGEVRRRGLLDRVIWVDRGETVDLPVRAVPDHPG